MIVGRVISTPFICFAKYKFYHPHNKILSYSAFRFSTSYYASVIGSYSVKAIYFNRCLVTWWR